MFFFQGDTRVIHQQDISNDYLKGGKIHSRDRDFGVKDTEFWRWWHRKGKPKNGNEDIKSKNQADDIYNKWLKQGKPKAK